jgi:hypothetical protein
MSVKTAISAGLITVIFITLSLISGCLSAPEEGGRGGLSSIPELLLDYDFELEQFSLYIMSAVGDYKYDYIKINLDDSEVIENNTYVLCYKTMKTNFTLEVEAQIDIDVFYYYTCEVEIVNNGEENTFLMITDSMELLEEEIPLSKEELPWKKILVKRE